MSNTTNLIILLLVLVCTYAGILLKGNDEECVPEKVGNVYGSICKVEDDLETLKQKSAGQVYDENGSDKYDNKE